MKLFKGGEDTLLEKSYTIPILFGICLGLILTGVHISTLALNASLGKQEIVPVVIERFDRDGLGMEFLGKNVYLPVPQQINRILDNSAYWVERFQYQWLENTSNFQGK